jgi:hypothetical protein
MVSNKIDDKEEVERSKYLPKTRAEVTATCSFKFEAYINYPEFMLPIDYAMSGFFTM